MKNFIKNNIGTIFFVLIVVVFVFLLVLKTNMNGKEYELYGGPGKGGPTNDMTFFLIPVVLVVMLFAGIFSKFRIKNKDKWKKK